MFRGLKRLTGIGVKFENLFDRRLEFDKPFEWRRAK